MTLALVTEDNLLDYVEELLNSEHRLYMFTLTMYKAEPNQVVWLERELATTSDLSWPLPKYVMRRDSKLAPIGPTVTDEGLRWYRQLTFDGKPTRTYHRVGLLEYEELLD